jgi:predicted amidohydrolase YtcJ
MARLAGLLCLACVLAAQAHEAPDTLLVNGRIVRFGATPDAAPAEALAVRAGRITALGRTKDLRATAGPATRVIDLGGRTVIPGLIDSHIHAIRAGLTHGSEVDWIGARSIREAMSRLKAKAGDTSRDAWLVVAGGWTEAQFAERRRPTRAEIARAAPGRKVYVQRLYTHVLLSPGGLEALGVPANPELASRLKVEEGADGQATGWLGGDARTISDLYDLLPRPSHAAQMAGTRAFFRKLNSLGITGVLDPGGYNLPVDAYGPLFQIWREGGLTLRVVYSLCAPRRDHELEDFQAATALLPMGMGDDWLRFNGIGENVTWGMYNNDAPTEERKERLYQVLRWASTRSLSATFHWNNNRSVEHLLQVIGRVNGETPVAPLRWSIAHLNDATQETLARMQALGVGWLMQDAMYFRGEEFAAQRGTDAASRAPPIASALRMGLHIGGGTDAHRVMSYNPFISLQWMLDGRTVGGAATRGAAETPTRLEALRLYTQGSAWFSHDEARRGELEVGMLADLVVLSRDYLKVPVKDIGRIRAVLTIVGGRVMYAGKQFLPGL